MSWRKAADQHGIPVEDLKEKLPLEWVIRVAAEIELVEDGEGKAKGICPFHEDTDPSLDVYGYGTRWGCFPCGHGGDVFDFIGDFWELTSFGARFEKAVALLVVYASDTAETPWDGVLKDTEPQMVVDDETIIKEVNWARGNATRIMYPIAQLLQNKGLEIPEFWLVEKWGLGVNDDLDVLAPYFASDGTITSYKTRSPGKGGWYARKGRKLTTLYGEHLLGDNPNVWICEGETDTWLASWLLRGRGVALGLPRGAGAQVDGAWLELLRGRRITLIFDADAAGRRASVRWYRALNGIAAEIHIAFPDGDLCETARPDLALDSGMAVNQPAGFIVEMADRSAYLQVSRSRPGEQINNWILDPTRFIMYLGLDGKEEHRGFEGHFTNDIGKQLLIKNTDLKNASTAGDWSNKHGKVWFAAGQKWAQAVLDELNSQAPFLVRVSAVATVGLHGVEEGNPVFVLPEEAGGVIGPEIAQERWMSYPEGTASDYSTQYRMMPVEMSRHDRTEWATPVVQALMSLNRTDVVTPLIAWLCAAPLRSLMREFPPIAVMGGSGSGKTTMLRWMLWTFFGVKEEHSMGQQSTPYGLTAWATGTNALPVWYDEYRAAARKDSMDAVNQVLRDAWSASASSRGGMGDDKSRVHDIRITAPMMISGESAFMERSHIDRIVVIQMPDKNAKGGMNLEALQLLVDSMEEKGRLGRLYLEWVIWRLSGDTLPAMTDVLDRQAQGEKVLEWGWKLWCEFNLDVFGLQINRSGLDLSNIRRERAHSDESPILTALEACIEQKATDRKDRPLAWIKEHGSGALKSVVSVRTHNFHRWAVADGYQLPGNSKSTGLWLTGRFIEVQSSGRLSWVDPFGTRHQPRGINLIGVMEAIEDELRDRPAGADNGLELATAST